MIIESYPTTYCDKEVLKINYVITKESLSRYKFFLDRISSNIFLGKIREIQAEDVVKVQSAGYQVDLLQSGDGLSEGGQCQGGEVVVTEVEMFQ